MSARAKLLALFLACAAPFVLAWVVWYFEWGTGARGNYGTLIEPRPLKGPPFSDLRGKWVMVTFDPSACDAYCERKLYYMRQVRTAQGKEQARVERLWIVTDAGEPRREVLADMEGTHIFRGDVSGFPGDPREHIYLVDPLGNLMLRFPRDPDPSRMLKDLKRLLKYARIG